MIDLSVTDEFSGPPLQDHQSRPRFRSVLTERERKLCDYLMMGYRINDELAALMGCRNRTLRTIYESAARKIVDPPASDPITKLIVWRAKQIGAVEAYLGLRDTDGNHMDDGIILQRAEEIERRREQIANEYAPRIVHPRQRRALIHNGKFAGKVAPDGA